MGAGEASSWFDAKIIDGAVNDAGWVTRAVATLSTWWDKWIIDGVVREWPCHCGADDLLSRAPVRMGIGAVVCPGHGRRFVRICECITCGSETAPSC